MAEVTKLYSKKSIGIATYLGGPLAAGILIRKNYINLNNDKQGLNALLSGIGTTLLLVAILVFTPEKIMDKIPTPLIPMIYTGAVYLILEKIQGKELEAFKQNNGTFYSVWRAVGISLVSALFLALPVIGYFFIIENDWDDTLYNSSIDALEKNETDALKLFELKNDTPTLDIIEFIDEIGIPKWEQNLVTLDSISRIKDIPEVHKTEITLMTEYTELRIKSFSLIKNAYMGFTNKFDDEIAEINERIFSIIEELEAL